MAARFGFASLLVAIFTGSAMAQTTVIVNENFDGYADQNAFETAWPRWEGGAGIPSGAPATLLPSGTLSTEQAKSPTNSVRIQADVATVPPDDNASAKSQRNQFALPQTTGLAAPDNVIKFSFDFYDVLTGGANGNPFPTFERAITRPGAAGSGRSIE